MSARPRVHLERLAAATAVLLALVACAHRYSEQREDWVGPRSGDFDADFAVCKEEMDALPFRFGGDPRLVFLDCMGKRGWVLKGAS